MKKKKSRYLPAHERFEQNIIKTNSCWNWTRCIRRGYGAFSANGKVFDAHRYSYEYYKGEIPNGLCVLHKCDNRKCVNPAHLFIGTRHDNAIDRIEKKRSASGENHGHAKLAWYDVHRIRKAKGKISRKHLSKMYKISTAQIGRIITGKNWIKKS